jgi:Ca2+-binding RTX toxin-like protein
MVTAVDKVIVPSFNDLSKQIAFANASASAANANTYPVSLNEVAAAVEDTMLDEADDADLTSEEVDAAEDGDVAETAAAETATVASADADFEDTGALADVDTEEATVAAADADVDGEDVEAAATTLTAADADADAEELSAQADARSAGGNVQNGTKGNDVLEGTKDKDVQFGLKGDDVLYGREGDDSQFGGAGLDVIYGGKGNDLLAGGAGDDTLLGNSGDDNLLGGAGDDILQGGGGADTIVGGKGYDTAVYAFPSHRYKIEQKDGVVYITNQAGKTDVLKGVEDLKFADKTIHVADVPEKDGGKVQNGTDGNDTINGTAGRDIQFGGKGDDVIRGRGGDDSMFGGAGLDVMYGGSGDDRIKGGAGDDTVVGGSGNDDLFGGTGDDILKGGSGADRLRGGEGYDTAVYAGKHSDYKIEVKDGVVLVTNKKGETDRLSGIESLQFSDKTIDCPTETPVDPEHPVDPKPPVDSEWHVSEIKDGKGTITLGDRYEIKLDESKSSWTIIDKSDCSETEIWGDPHVDVGNEGKTDWDFKKDSSFVLEDGTKITVNTVEVNKKGATVSSTLTITNGENAVQVTGLASKADGKDNLAVVQSNDGVKLDESTDDGAFTVKEAGTNWTINGQTVTQALINQAEAGGQA